MVIRIQEYNVLICVENTAKILMVYKTGLIFLFKIIRFYKI